MNKKSILIIVLVIVLIAVVAVVASMTLEGNSNTTTNITNNTTNTTNTTQNSTSEPQIVSVEWVENQQAGDGSKMKVVTYSDGNIRQYDINGNLIGSTFQSDQKYLPSME